MKYNLDQLNEYVEKGLLDRKSHPTLPLFTYKYTRACQYGRLWDDITINMRGTVIDNEGNLVAATLPKFFNIEEMVNSIPNESFEVFDKLDGSLIILFNYSDQWIFASSGSFMSEQAIMAKNISIKYDFKNLDKNLTYLFEIIY